MPSSPDRFRLLATHLAGTAVEVTSAPPGQAPYTDGLVIYVSADDDPGILRRQIVVQSALIGAASLDPQIVKALRGRPSVASRYLAIEGRRVLAELARTLPLAAEFGVDSSVVSSAESLQIADGRAAVAPAPAWFGVIKPSKLLASHRESGSRATDQDMRLQFDSVAVDDEDGDENQPDDSKILKLFEAPTGARAIANFFSRMFRGSRTQSDQTAGAEAQLGSARRVHRVGPNVRPLPTRIHFSDEKPGAAIGIGGALHPEWDHHRNRYRPDWCRVIDFPVTTPADVSAAGVVRDDVLRRRLSRVGLSPRVLRGRPDGDELDIEALIDLFVDLQSGHSPPEHVYNEHRKLARNLGVLVLLDASGSATDTDSDGLAVHEHQRRAAATLAVTLEELGDRVAVYAFRSHGRHAVHLPAIKTFDQGFGAVARARLNQLQPSGYTRLGAGIRGAGEILKSEAGTPNRLLVVLSDGFPYDHGYEGRYAEADASKALEELRADGVACLCLSLGAATGLDALERVFGSASHASAATMTDLSPQMDELFLSALAELAAPARSARG
ncbi:nitric oxide reductase activation protein NorD [Mycolicibacterium rhodesiae]|nr:VWA domain-containing protein [Mycolicibacterium rhodesiae]